VLDCGLGHRATVIIIYTFNIMVIGISIACFKLNASFALVMVVLFALLNAGILQLVYRTKNKTVKPPTPED
jgi:uncharacterized membrane protein HdeD (DUF308 family)